MYGVQDEILSAIAELVQIIQAISAELYDETEFIIPVFKINPARSYIPAPATKKKSLAFARDFFFILG
ncbi:MAG TPA: hypothetical protein PKV52_02565 [Candidatus Saccharibacteria bacterium]|nr:hypothetical protein [Candidatus Saccharibacteria bacterium]